ncbi:4Fe-4S binding protein [Pandoraea capi]
MECLRCVRVCPSDARTT